MITTHHCAQDFTALPADIRDLRQFVNWKKIADSNGRILKMPVDARGKPRKSWQQDPSFWTGFEEAVGAVGRDGIEGIGIVLAGEPGVAGLTELAAIDLDWKHSKDFPGSEIPPHLLQIVADLESYTEFSPSGRGLRVLVRGDLGRLKTISGSPTKHWADGTEVSVIWNAHFATLTGTALRVYPDSVMVRPLEMVFSHLFPHAASCTEALPSPEKPRLPSPATRPVCSARVESPAGSSAT
jgi:primase-polymerase (primpol)-like protein